MTAPSIRDLPLDRALDYKAMSTIKGAGGAPWIFGAFRAFLPEIARISPIVNFYQTNFIADQLNVQFQTIDVETAATNAVINVNPGQNAMNFNFGAALPRP